MPSIRLGGLNSNETVSRGRWHAHGKSDNTPDSNQQSATGLDIQPASIFLGKVQSISSMNGNGNASTKSLPIAIPNGRVSPNGNNELADETGTPTSTPRLSRPSSLDNFMGSRKPSKNLYDDFNSSPKPVTTLDNNGDNQHARDQASTSSAQPPRRSSSDDIMCRRSPSTTLTTSITQNSADPDIPIGQKKQIHNVASEKADIGECKVDEAGLPCSISPQSLRSSLDEFAGTRRTSVTFDPTVRLDSGAHQQMEEPLQRIKRSRERGRSLLQALAEDMEHMQRPHSEFTRNQHNPITGELIPVPGRRQRDAPQVGILRHPLLPQTVDDLAHESHNNQPASMTTEATLSPSVGDIQTPPDNKHGYLLSPTISSMSAVQTHSYDEPASASRYMSRSQTAAGDFFSRASSMRKSPMNAASRSGPRRSTSSSAKSPQSAASSFLSRYSRSRPGPNGGDDNRPVSPDAEGQTIGDDYVLGKQIGFGGFSVIKEAFHVKPDMSQRKIAAKIVRRNIKDKNEHENEQAQAEFDHEVELWRFLRHPRILPLEMVYKTEDATFCFIPLNEGGTLFDLVRANRSGLPLHLAKRYIYQLGTAIRYLHEDARVAHRDIKLENCLLDTSVDPANVRLCDFGMAEWITNDPEDSLSSSDFDDPPSPNFNSADRPPQRPMGPSDSSTSAFAGGSLEYAAPEIVRIASQTSSASANRAAERGVVSPASDMWSFGVCAYSMIVGSRPFSDPLMPSRVMTSIMAGDWDQEKLREKGGEDALMLVEACLEMDVRNRADINEVLSFDWLREEAEREEEEGESGRGVFGKRGAWGMS